MSNIKPKSRNIYFALKLVSAFFPSFSKHPKVLGVPLVFEIGCHLCENIHLIRVVFQDQAMYARTLFRGAQMSKIWKKGVFLVMVTNFGKMTEN